MRNHNIEVMTSSQDQDWSTPQSFVDALPFDFNLDVCATRDNTKCEFWLDPEFDALSRNWIDPVYLNPAVCYMNPPYSRNIGDWIEKAYEQSQQGCLVVCLVPNRTETNWFARIWSDASLICFVGRRIKFLHPDRNKQKNGAPFANVVAVFGEEFPKVLLKQKGVIPGYPDSILYDESPEGYAQEMSKIGTVILPGAGNLWLWKDGEK